MGRNDRNRTEHGDTAREEPHLDRRDFVKMAGWVTTGVTSRLNVSTVRELSPNARTETNLDEFVDLAGETVGEYSYTGFPPHRPIVIHATHDKGHLLGGYYRFTPEGELISETRSVGIRILQGRGVGERRRLGASDPSRPLELGRLIASGDEHRLVMSRV